MAITGASLAFNLISFLAIKPGANYQPLFRYLRIYSTYIYYLNFSCKCFIVHIRVNIIRYIYYI
jgi:hypothetical protein